MLGMIDMMHAVVERGTGAARAPSRHQCRRQDRHDQRLPRCLVRRLHRQLQTAAVWLGNDNYAPTNQLTGGILPAATWAKYMRVAMAYEKPIPLPGLPPPDDDRRAARRRQPIRRAVGFDPGASGPPRRRDLRRARPAGGALQEGDAQRRRCSQAALDARRRRPSRRPT